MLKVICPIVLFCMMVTMTIAQAQPFQIHGPDQGQANQYLLVHTFPETGGRLIYPVRIIGELTPENLQGVLMVFLDAVNQGIRLHFAPTETQAATIVGALRRLDPGPPLRGVAQARVEMPRITIHAPTLAGRLIIHDLYIEITEQGNARDPRTMTFGAPRHAAAITNPPVQQPTTTRATRLTRLGSGGLNYGGNGCS